MLTIKHHDVVETNTKETKLSDHRLAELLIGYNPLSPKGSNLASYDKNSFRAIDFNRADFEGINDQLADVIGFTSSISVVKMKVGVSSWNSSD